MDLKPTVWVIQNKTRFNIHTKERENIIDYSVAEEYGNIKILLEDNDSVMAQQPIILKLKRELIKFSKEDSLLLLGDYALIGAAFVVVSQFNHGDVPVLIFDKYTRTYYRKIYRFYN